METDQKTNSPCDIQADIYRLALSLDSLLINGIQFSVIQATADNGFVKKLSETLLGDFDVLQNDLHHAPADEQQQARETLAQMRSELLDLTDLLTRLVWFRAFSVTEVRSAVSRLGRHRERVIRLIGDLEKCFHTPKPFYATRPKEAVASVDGFLADLPPILEMEWHTAKSKAGAHSA